MTKRKSHVHVPSTTGNAEEAAVCKFTIQNQNQSPRKNHDLLSCFSLPSLKKLYSWPNEHIFSHCPVHSHRLCIMGEK